MSEIVFIEDGYPTVAALQRIEMWDFEKGWGDFMKFVESIWWAADWGWRKEEKMDETHERPVNAYNISTGGWSGNESIIRAMQKNWMFWSQCWVQSRRGGHYIFYIEKRKI